MPGMGVPELMVASAIVSAAGTAYSGVAAYQQGQSEQRNAYALARGEQAAATENARRERDVGARAVGQQAAMFGASGFEGASGTPASITADTMAQAELRALDALTTGANQAKGLRYKGAMAKWQGTNQMIGSFIGAGAQLAGGFAEAGMYAKPPANPNSFLPQTSRSFIPTGKMPTIGPG